MSTIQITKIIPARPERTHVEPAQPAREEVTEMRVCDACRKPKRFRKIKECGICGCDVCGTCKACDPADFSDYPVWWCPVCLQLHGDKYDAILFQLADDYDELKLKAEDAWKAESLAAQAAKGDE